MKALLAQNAGELLDIAGFKAASDFVMRINDNNLLAKMAVVSVIEDWVYSIPYILKDLEYEKQKKLEEKIQEPVNEKRWMFP